MFKINTTEAINISKLLSDKNRIEIIKLLSDEETCACNLLEHLKIKQPTLSHHMKQLSEAEIVTVNKKSTWSYYTLNKEKINEYIKFIEDCTKQKTEIKSCKC